MQKVVYEGDVKQRGPSGFFLGRSRFLQIRSGDFNAGVADLDDFTRCPVFATATDAMGYITYQDSGVTIQGLATEQYGVLQIAGADADNDEGSLETGSGKHGLLKIDKNLGAVFFETRVRFPVITDWAAFIGLAEEGLAAADTLVDNTGAVADKDYVGFRILTADPDGLDAVHRTNGGSEVVVKNEAQVVVAATWYKLGLYFDGKTTITYYVDGVSVGTVEEDDTDFPDGEELAVLFAIKTGAAVEKKLDVDWWAFCQHSA